MTDEVEHNNQIVHARGEGMVAVVETMTTTTTLTTMMTTAAVEAATQQSNITLKRGRDGDGHGLTRRQEGRIQTQQSNN